MKFIHKEFFMNTEELKLKIKGGKTSLGIELGSTTIKAVLLTDDFKQIASGSYVWKNQLKNNIWTYDLDSVWEGIQTSYEQIKLEVKKQFDIELEHIGYIGVSAMMHGYLAFDKANNLLVPFRTWRNNITAESADKLTKLFNFNIPQRWSIAHLYQAILNKEKHVANISYITTLAGYVSWQLTGNKNLGIGDASGMFPIDEKTKNYDQQKLQKFNNLPEVKEFDWNIQDILPEVLVAGKCAGTLTKNGAKLLDPLGNLKPGAKFAPSEGDAGTGMVATNSISKNTGNISVGTSAFSMIVLEKQLKDVHKDIDIVSTPDGLPVAMVHINNCSSDINDWVSIFKSFAKLIGQDISSGELYQKLFEESQKGEDNAGELVNFAYLSGENITEVENGRPIFIRKPDSNFTLANLFKTQIYSAFAPLKIGMDILSKEENIKPKSLIAQGGLFKTPVVAQQVLANALNTPIMVMDNAGTGGAWGMAVLGLYLNYSSEINLSDFLKKYIFNDVKSTTLNPNEAGVKGYQEFMENYKQMLPAEKLAGQEKKA